MFDCCASLKTIITSQEMFQQKLDIIASSSTLPVCGVGTEKGRARPLLSA